METSDNIAKTTSLQRLIMTSLNKTLQRRRFCNVIRRFHRSYMVTSEWRRIVTSQQRCNDVIESTGLICYLNAYYAILYSKRMASGIQAIDKTNELLSVMNVCRNVFHNGAMAYTCYKFMKVLST